MSNYSLKRKICHAVLCKYFSLWLVEQENLPIANILSDLILVALTDFLKKIKSLKSEHRMAS